LRDRLERRLGTELDGVEGAAARDLADHGHLPDLVGDLDGADPSFLRASRIPRVRPILVVLAARASGGGAVDPELQYAAELLHVALSLHDLALGQPGGRRRTLARSVLRGMGWIGSNRVLLRAMELARHGPTPEVLSDLVDTLGSFQDAHEIAERLAAEGAPPTLEAWSDHASGQMGALFAFCCRAGAHVSGCSPGELAAFARFGRHLGRLWHVAEDVVLLQADDAVEHLVGRALLGRPMLPVAVGIERAGDVAELWRRLVVDHDRDAAGRLLERLGEVRAIPGTREQVAQEHWAARQALARFEDTPYRHALERLASGLSRAPFEDAAPGPVYER
jgi:hypothetical protein